MINHFSSLFKQHINLPKINIKKTLMITGFSILVGAITTDQAQAANLRPIKSDTDFLPLPTMAEETSAGVTNPQNWADLDELADIEWIAGQPGSSSGGIGPQGTGLGQVGSWNVNWESGVAIPFLLSYDQGTGISSITVNNGTSINYQGPASVPFDRFRIFAQARDDNTSKEPDPGTSIELNILSLTDINNTTTNPGISVSVTKANANDTFRSDSYYWSDTAIQELQGNIVLNWTGADPRNDKRSGSRLFIRLQTFDSPFESPVASPFEGPVESSTTPEPSSYLGFLLLGTLGAASVLTRKLKN